MGTTTTIWSIILAFMISSNTAFTEKQIRTMYNSGFWDGSVITSGDTSYEVRNGYLLINDERGSEPIPIDSSVKNYGVVLASNYTNKFGTGSWILGIYDETIRFDIKETNFVKIECKESWNATVKKGKYIVVTDAKRKDKKLFRINMKNGKVKKY